MIDSVSETVEQKIDNAYMQVQNLVVEKTGASPDLVGQSFTNARFSGLFGLMTFLQGYITEMLTDKGSSTNAAGLIDSMNTGSMGIQNFGQAGGRSSTSLSSFAGRVLYKFSG